MAAVEDLAVEITGGARGSVFGQLDRVARHVQLAVPRAHQLLPEAGPGVVQPELEPFVLLLPRPAAGPPALHIVSEDTI